MSSIVIEEVIFSGLLYNEDYTRATIPHIKQDYFYSGVQKRLFTYIHTFFEKYNRLPTPAVLSIALEKDSRVSEIEYKEGIEYINALSFQTQETKWLVDETEKFCKERALYNALAQSLEIKENSEKPIEQQNKKLLDVSAIPELMKDALSVSFDKSVGHDYFGDADKRWDVYHDRQQKIPFDIGVLNAITNGGVEYKTLNVILASTNVGKSLGLCHLAASYMAAGHDVLYISMEMGEIQGVAKRIDANLFNLAIETVQSLDPGTYATKIKRLQENITGKLVIKQYPTGGAHVGHLRALMNELKIKKNFTPRIVIVDYLGVMCSMRIRGYSENSYALVGAIAEELRGFAIEHDVCVWSAAQTTRGSWDSSDINMSDTAESAKLVHTVDFMLGVFETEETVALGQQMFKTLKSRYGNKDKIPKFVLGVDKDKQKWYEIDAAAPASQSELHKAQVPTFHKPASKLNKPDVAGWTFD